MLPLQFPTYDFVRYLTRRWRLRVFVLGTLCLVVQSSVYAQVDVNQNANGDTAKVSVQQDPELAGVALGRDLQHFEKSIKPLLKQACFECHSEENVEGNFRADQLDPDLVNGEDIAWWLEVYSALSKGDMPPPDSSELSDSDRILIVDWLSTEIQTAEKLRKTRGNHTSFRRLTRYEYNYALQDLLGVPWTFAGDLPAEASEDGAFENNADLLHMSVKQVETYHQIALNALQRITVQGDRPSEVHWAISMKDAFQREKKRLNQDIQAARKKFDDDPDKQAAEVKKLKKQFQAPANRSHYLDVSTGVRAEIDWNYRKAVYAFQHNETYQAMPETDAYFAVVQPGGREGLTVELGDHLPDEGTLRVRIRASRAEGVETRIPSLQLHFGFQATDQGRSIKRLSTSDVKIKAAYGQPEVYEWNFPLGEIEHRNTYRGEMKLGQQPSPSEYLRFTNSTIADNGADSESSAILIDFVEVAAPVYDEWPPQSHRNVFIESKHKDDETQYAGEIIESFLSRAWRRSPSAEDIDRKLRLFHKIRPSSTDFQEAIVEVLATILTSPKFLYVLPGQQQLQAVEVNDGLSQNELATRLSLFLWCSLPDDTLLELASAGRLGDDQVLRQQVDRMLADPRSNRFTKHFVQQWLKMQPLEFLSPTRGNDGLDEALLESMKHEPVALFADMLQQNSSVVDFIDADYLVVNERLAKHYGIPGVQGNHFRRAALPVDRDRGGLLTQAGLLTMNSSGRDSHPVKRGVWLLTNLLNDPPPPPPPAVPEIDLSDPRIAKMTLKERIDDHRNHAACMSCHQKIDPWGVAFENYDATGRWRDQINGKTVDATSVLPSKTSLDGMKGLKEHLKSNHQEQFVKATVQKLATFALGRQLDFNDRAEIRQITGRIQESGDGIRTMVTSLITSELFKAK